VGAFAYLLSRGSGRKLPDKRDQVLTTDEPHAQR
jgi:hypothetical protein